MGFCSCLQELIEIIETKIQKILGCDFKFEIPKVGFMLFAIN